MSERTSRQKKQLGMPYGTACSRLRKIILFEVLRRHGENTCFRCEKKINSSSELSVEHKLPWENEDTSRFWDLDNIAFSHLFCNISHSARTTVKGFRFKNGHAAYGKRNVSPGFAWCSRCKSEKHASDFNKNSSRFNGLCSECKECQHKPYGSIA